ncbi:MAG: DEAD/DEAH box helicase [Candidatus Woesearchaeota archaeon]
MNIFKGFEPRVYQQTLCASALSKNSLVVLPTGLGKTAIAMMVAAGRLKKFPESKILMLAPTRPLVSQHKESFEDFLDMQFVHPDAMTVFTGTIKSEKRQELWADSKIIFSTPQGLENDVLSGKISLKDVSLIIFDEAHRATGDYSYVWLAKQYMRQSKNPLILALTASPGNSRDVIQEICSNMYIQNIEVRDKTSPDVAPYVKETKIDWREVTLPASFTEIIKPLETMVLSKVHNIKQYLTAINPRIAANPKFASKKDLLMLQAKLQGMIAKESDPELYQVISVVAQIIKLQHAIELLQTQGVSPARQYMDDLWSQGMKAKSKAAQAITNDSSFRIALSKLWKLDDDKVLHPKLLELESIVTEYIQKKPDAKIIIFNNYRDSIVHLKAMLDKAKVSSEIFVGQAKKKGMGITQKEQLQLIQDFRNEKFNVLIMSSVGEEGLDIPAVDLVVFYEPVPSTIRQIQRAGRTGRQDKGHVIILMAKNTRDVAYFWSTKRKEKSMYDSLNKMKETLSLPSFESAQSSLADIPASNDDSKSTTDLQENSIPSENAKSIIVDMREKANRIVKHFVDEGYTIDLKQLPAGDYILNEDVGVEFKTKKDFVDSIVDGRLFDQASALTRAFAKPLFVVQGEEDVYAIRNISPQAVNGAISTLALSFGLPVIFTRNEQESFALFKSIAEKRKSTLQYSAHAAKPKSLEEQQLFVVQSLPLVGPTLAIELLRHFKTVDAIIKAPLDELSKIKNMGPKKAEKIKTVLEKEFIE